MKLLLRAAVLGFAVATTSVVAATGVMAAGYDVNATTTGLALRGYDPVSYFNGGPEAGSFQITAVYDEATYRFVSLESKNSFLENPEAYVPAFGGYCAYGLAIGSKFDGDPNVWKIVAGKLYLNLAAPVQALWVQDLEGNLDKAETNWDRIEDLDPADTLS